MSFRIKTHDSGGSNSSKSHNKTFFLTGDYFFGIGDYFEILGAKWLLENKVNFVPWIKGLISNTKEKYHVFYGIQTYPVNVCFMSSAIKITAGLSVASPPHPPLPYLPVTFNPLSPDIKMHI